jgi:hypothetical protein
MIFGKKHADPLYEALPNRFLHRRDRLISGAIARANASKYNDMWAVDAVYLRTMMTTTTTIAQRIY